MFDSQMERNLYDEMYFSFFIFQFLERSFTTTFDLCFLKSTDLISISSAFFYQTL
jgi:hypothetical protein